MLVLASVQGASIIIGRHGLDRERGQGTFYFFGELLGGRPVGRRLDSMPSLCAIRERQRGLPNGEPRSMLLRTSASSQGLNEALTHLSSLYTLCRPFTLSHP